MMPDATDARLRLTPTQQRLYEALLERRADIGEWYRAAIAVTNDPGLPDRLSLAAHSLREVMEKLPGDEFRPDRGADLPRKVRELRPPWDGAHEENQRSGGKWQGEISAPVREFLTAMEAFFAEQERLTMSRADYARLFLASLDGGGGLPDSVQRQNAKQWMDFHRYFDGVAHHSSVKEEGFTARMSGFEVFIASKLKPRPTEDFATIDALLEDD